MNIANKGRIKNISWFEDLIYLANSSIGRISGIFSLLKNRREHIYTPSYFPEAPLKSKRQIFFEQLAHVIKHGEINTLYFLMGADRKSEKLEKTTSQKKLRYARCKKNQVPLNALQPYNFICVLRDKFIFGAFCAGVGIRTSKNIALIHNQNIHHFNSNAVLSLDNIIELEFDGFCKLLNGDQGRGAFCLKVKEHVIYQNDEIISFEKLKQLIQNQQWLIQERITDQHPVINEIYDQSINTLRIITINQGDSIFAAPVILRIGAYGNRVDNWNAGGLFVPVNMQTGTLEKYGFHKQSFGRKTAVHPQSGVVFEGIQIPFFKESVNEAKRFHSLLSGIHSIGWDIAVTKDGPLFIEGNDDWDPSYFAIAYNLSAEKLKQFTTFRK